MRKLWVKAWLTPDGVFDADTMDHWWQNTNSPERMRYITEEYAKGDAYLLGRVTCEIDLIGNRGAGGAWPLRTSPVGRAYSPTARGLSGTSAVTDSQITASNL
jgi:hypothetical protein